MSTSSDTTLGFLRIQARQRSDLENNNSVSDAEFNQYVSQSYKRLYAMLVAAYGNDYFVSNYYQFSMTNAQLYPLPDGTPSFTDSTGAIAPKFFKLLEVDLQYSSSPSGYVSMKRFEEIERNKFANPNVAINWNGYTNLRYRISGSNLSVVPIPQAGQVARIKYVPAPTNLQYSLPGYCVAGSGIIGSMTDTTGITSGMNIFSYQQNVLPSNLTVTSVATTSMNISGNALSTNNANIFAMWNDGAVLDGIAGWEEYIVIDAAIKAQLKQDDPAQELMGERQALRLEIEAMAEARDVGQAFHVSDVLGANGWDMGSDGGGDYGW